MFSSSGKIAPLPVGDNKVALERLSRHELGTTGLASQPSLRVSRGLGKRLVVHVSDHHGCRAEDARGRRSRKADGPAPAA
jgi:hypothetical protein